jgi:WD40 repeat protein
MNEIPAWRFLVSRNQFLDYRTVVAPDFMCQANVSSLLAKAAEGDPIKDESPYCREIHGSKVGDLTIIYRIIEAQAKDINAEFDGVLKDSFGREIFWIEGIVFKGINIPISVTLEDLELNHKNLINDYRDFWEWVSPQPCISSLSDVSILQGEGNPLKFRQVPEYLVINSSSARQEQSNKNTSSNLNQSSLSHLFSFEGQVYFSRFLDNSRLLIHQYDKEVIILDWEKDTKKVLIKGNWNRYIRQIVLSSDAKFLCTFNIVSGLPDRNTLKIWDLNKSNERELIENSLSELGRVNAFAFSHDGTVVATDIKSPLSSSVPIKLIDTKSGGIRGELNWHTSNIKCIESNRYNRFDNIFASGDGQGFVKIWDWKTLKRIGSLPSHGSMVNTIAFSPHAKILVSGGDDGKIKIASYKNGVEDQGLLGECSDWVGGVNALAFSPDGKIVASGGDDGKVKLWDVNNKKQISEFSEHNMPVMSVSFSPNGKLLASGSKDKTVRIWRLG